MKLFIIQHTTGAKVYLKVVASTRQELARILGGSHFNALGKTYSVNDVLAEKESSNAVAGVILGGILGLLAGPWGAITGSAAGGVIGSSADDADQNRVKLFNESSYHYGLW